MKNKIPLLWCVATLLAVPSIIQAHDYFPLEKGDGWLYKNTDNNKRFDNFYSVHDSLIAGGNVYYIMQCFVAYYGLITFPDTIRKDAAGNIWRYGKQKDILWFNLTEDTSVMYPYNNYSVKKRIVDTITTPSGLYKQCLSLTFTDLGNVRYIYIFKDSIGIIAQTFFYTNNVQAWDIRLKSAVVKGAIIGTQTNKYDYFPLKKGNTWAYLMEWSKDTLIHQVVDTQSIDGIVYYHITTYSSRSKKREEYYLRKDTITGNVYKRVGQQDELFNNTMYSIVEGEPWFYKSNNSDSAIESWGEQSMTVPAGTFAHCRFYMMDNMPGMFDDELYYAYAPGVGRIYFNNDGSIPWSQKLLYAIIDGEYIGPIVGISQIDKIQKGTKKSPRVYLFDNDLKKTLMQNHDLKIFTLNGRAVLNATMPNSKGVNLAKSVYIIKTKDKN
jgi:hypothetical protein